MSLEAIPPISSSFGSAAEFETDLTFSEQDTSDEESIRLDHLRIQDHPLIRDDRNPIVVPSSVTMRALPAGAVKVVTQINSSLSGNRPPRFNAGPSASGILISLFGALTGSVRYDYDGPKATGGKWNSWEFDTRMFRYADRSRQRWQEFRQSLNGRDDSERVEIEWDNPWDAILNLRSACMRDVTGDEISELEQRLRAEKWERIVASQLSRRLAAQEMMEELAVMLETQARLLAVLSNSSSSGIENSTNGR